MATVAGWSTRLMLCKSDSKDRLAVPAARKTNGNGVSRRVKKRKDPMC